MVFKSKIESWFGIGIIFYKFRKVYAIFWRFTMQFILGTPPHYTIMSDSWLHNKSILQFIKYYERLIGMQLTDIGCGDQRYKKILKNSTNYIGLDYKITKDKFYHNCSPPSLFGDIQELPFKDSSLEFILCTEVLEHIRDMKEALTEISRVSKKGAHIIVTIPFLFANHDNPRDFRRLTIEGLVAEFDLAGWELLDSRLVGGFGSVIAMLSSRFIVSLLKKSIIGKIFYYGPGIVFLPVLFFSLNICAILLDLFQVTNCYSGSAAIFKKS